MIRLSLTSDGVEATLEIGRRLGAGLASGHLIALAGPLGSGKTTLVKGIAAGAGVADPRQVNSPTFVIVNEYEAAPGGQALRMYHVDAYRLRGGGDLEALGFDEMVAQGAVVLEWADRVRDLLQADHLGVEIAVLDEGRRRLDVAAHGPVSAALLRRLAPRGGPSLAPGCSA